MDKGLILFFVWIIVSMIAAPFFGRRLKEEREFLEAKAEKGKENG